MDNSEEIIMSHHPFAEYSISKPRLRIVLFSRRNSGQETDYDDGWEGNRYLITVKFHKTIQF